MLQRRCPLAWIEDRILVLVTPWMVLLTPALHAKRSVAHSSVLPFRLRDSCGREACHFCESQTGSDEAVYVPLRPLNAGVRHATIEIPSGE